MNPQNFKMHKIYMKNKVETLHQNHMHDTLHIIHTFQFILNFSISHNKTYFIKNIYFHRVQKSCFSFHSYYEHLKSFCSILCQCFRFIVIVNFFVPSNVPSPIFAIRQKYSSTSSTSVKLLANNSLSLVFSLF